MINTMVASHFLQQSQSNSTAKESREKIWEKIENYLLNTPFWQKEQNTVEKEFRDLFYQPDNNPAAIAREVEQIERSDFTNLLQKRGVFTQERIEHLSQWFQSICQEVVETAKAARSRKNGMELLAKVQLYLIATPKSEFSPQEIDRHFTSLLKDKKASYEQLSDRLSQFNAFTLKRILEIRDDLSPLEISAIITELEMARDRVLEAARSNY